ncbi:MAG: cupin domain-containing protein [Nitrosarchaeum sp.]|mgnify:CR=1 FL=1|nr:cupin domain-containing protein [Nitrosarchaeum sp.]MCA9819790.1 cupin domain-containing protein [Nitrosarchaeum sp.]
MKIDFDIDRYVKRVRDGKNYFHTFINKESLAAGVLVLKPGEEDTQEPHENDEVYYVLTGNGFLRINNNDHVVSPKLMYYVRKDTPHHFHSNSEELVVLYFFGGPDN